MFDSIVNFNLKISIQNIFYLRWRRNLLKENFGIKMNSLRKEKNSLVRVMNH